MKTKQKSFCFFIWLILIQIQPLAAQFDKVVQEYGIIATIAGKGDFGEKGFNGWQEVYEGGSAIETELSRSHFAMADKSGFIYIADNDAHAIRIILPDGTIQTFAGTGIAGYDSDGIAKEHQLSSPNGLWVMGDSTLYILDLGNSKIRKVSKDGVMHTIIYNPNGISNGRDLWVSENEKEIFFSSGTKVRMWSQDNRLVTFAEGFSQLDNIFVDPSGDVVVTDRSADLVNSFCSNENTAHQNLESLDSPVQIDDGWSVASLSDVNIDSAKLQIMVDNIRDKTYQNIHSVLIIKNGKLVFEQYFPGYKFNYDVENFEGEYANFNLNTLHNLASVTKSITSILFGIACDQGLIKSLDTKLFNYFPQYNVLNDCLKNQITLLHLLTMTSGLQWNEQDVFYRDTKNDIIQLFMVKDPVRYILSKPVINQPGSQFYYNGGNTNLLGEVIQQTSGFMADTFARKYFFGPLGIKHYSWVYINPDMVYASGDLRLRPRDMAKIGYLMLNDGIWDEQHIVSSKWIEESTKPYVRFNTKEGYGYQWWIKNYELGQTVINSFAAMGWGGQNIIVLPQLDAILILTAGNYATESPNDEIIYRYLLPSLDNTFKYDYNKIKEEAPIQESFKIIKPSDSVSTIAKYSGHWYGRGDFSIADQFVVERIDASEASVLYSWGDHPDGYFEKGWLRTSAIIDRSGRLTFNLDSAKLTFELDKHEDVLIGYYEKGEARSKLIMNRL